MNLSADELAPFLVLAGSILALVAISIAIFLTHRKSNLYNDLLDDFNDRHSH